MFDLITAYGCALSYIVIPHPAKRIEMRTSELPRLGTNYVTKDILPWSPFRLEVEAVKMTSQFISF